VAESRRRQRLCVASRNNQTLDREQDPIDIHMFLNIL